MGDAGLTFSADEVILTDGATEALSATFMAMLNPATRSSSPRLPLACTRASSWPTTPRRSFWIRSLRNSRLTRTHFVLA